ncbi:MAG: decaprenyl-phosphate phosphoribosyltransferase [Chloroflexota bacterium]|jgi:4-hydroxybenzoate polyprenyltransferase|nr:decaprenyl-phosphate phosphoribosyltransferase [Chloroflexota bacterium]
MSLTNIIKGLLRTMRPKQWLKNGFVFLPLVFDFKMFVTKPLVNTLVGFIVLCALSSVVYLINDAVDAPQDRLHPKKKNRPIAKGIVSIRLAIGCAIVLGILSLTLAFWLNPLFGVVAATYLAMQIAYSFVLKHVVLVDVFVIAIGFVLRVVAGIPLVDAERFSPWLFVCTLFMSLLLGFGKRRQEIVELKGSSNTRAILSEYNLSLLDQIIPIITAGLIVSYSFYTFSAPQLPTNHAMMITIPVAMYGLFRYLYLVHVRGEGGAPDELLFRDRPLLLATLLFSLIAILVLYVFR